MTDLIEVRVSNLIGLALDWATGIADGRELELPGAVRGRTSVVWCDPFVVKRDGHPDFHDKTRRKWQPSTDWNTGGPLIDKYLGSAHHNPHLEDSNCQYSAGPAGAGIWLYGPTALVAFCRTLVITKLGDTVQVPKELIPCQA